MKPTIGIRPTIDGRWGGVRESLEEQTMGMAIAAKKLIEENCFYLDGTPARVVIADTTIGGVAEASKCEEKFITENVVATLTVTPCWCYGTETMDLNPHTVKAVWGFNGTERPGAVYLAAVMAAYAQRGLPAFSIYGHDVQEADDRSIPCDVQKKIINYAQCSLAVGQMKNKSYVGIGAVAMGIGGSYVDMNFMQKYLGMRAEWVDMIEIQRRIDLGIYDHEEYKKALAWKNANCPDGEDFNITKLTEEKKKNDWEYVVKMTLIMRDIMVGNEKLNDIGRHEEALGRNAIAGGFQGQRQWTDYLPNADFTESILNSSFDWNGKRQPITFATENDSLNGLAMLFGTLITGSPSGFSDVRTYWSPDAIKKATNWKPEGTAKDGFMHLINSGATCLDACGACKDAEGKPVMKRWFDMTNKDIDACLKATDWAPANLQYFRGGGFSSHFETRVNMPITLSRINLVDGIGPVLQIAEGTTVELPEKVSKILWERTDRTWPCTWFAPRLTGKGAFTDVYSVMANWGANHGAFTYGHVGDKLITLASILRIPVAMHNIEDERIYRPHAFAAFGTQDKEGADFRACKNYGPIYK